MKVKHFDTCFPNSPKKLLVPKQLSLNNNDPGVFFGSLRSRGYVGMRQGKDGNILVIGGTDSGKSSGIVKPTLET